MYIKYRVKRNSGPVHEPIPAHPDAIYRPQHRPIPPDSSVAAPRILANSPMVAAPLAAGGAGGFPLGWIIGPLIALLTAIALAGLIYAIKKKQNLDTKAQHGEEEDKEENNPPQKKDIFNIKSRPDRTENLDDDHQYEDKSSVENIPLKTMKSDLLSQEKQKTISTSSSTAPGD